MFSREEEKQRMHLSLVIQTALTCVRPNKCVKAFILKIGPIYFSKGTEKCNINMKTLSEYGKPILTAHTRISKHSKWYMAVKMFI